MPVALHRSPVLVFLLSALSRATVAQECPLEIEAKCYWYDDYPDTKCHEIEVPEDCKSLDKQISFIYKFRNDHDGRVEIVALESTREGRTTSQMDQFTKTPFFPEMIATQGSIIGENFGSLNICEDGVLDTDFLVRAIVNKGTPDEFTCTKTTSYRYDLAREQLPPPTDTSGCSKSREVCDDIPCCGAKDACVNVLGLEGKRCITSTAPVPAPPTAAPPPPEPTVPAAELNTEFVRKRLKYKECRWIAYFPFERRSMICGDRASARFICKASCSEEGCVRLEDGSFSSEQCKSEYKELYRHSKLKVKTCAWLRDSPKKSNICRKVDEAATKCPTVCSEQ